ncbi:MsnO8 family LLM class oxidoreductase [Streptomyces hebeiensis]
MSVIPPVQLSVLDTTIIGRTPESAFADTIALARHAERLGYARYWMAEHHGAPGVGSSAPAITVGAIAAAASRIRVGAGGVMLPNHVPLVVAEQFGTLAARYPGRIDLGVGRAVPGTVDADRARPGARELPIGRLRRPCGATCRLPHRLVPPAAPLRAGARVPAGCLQASLAAVRGLAA